MSPNETLADLTEDFSCEEGLPQDEPRETASVTRSSSRARAGAGADKNRLSVISQKYDIDGDGILDEAEQAMRDMDVAGAGHLENDKVYAILQQQITMQKQMFNMKRVIFGLGAFTVILALSNLGTAWAAAVLAKDTTVDSSGNMYTSKDHKMVGTEAMVPVFEATPGESERRERGLALYDDEGTGTISDTIVPFLDTCTNANLRIKYTCPSDTIKFHDFNCGSDNFANTRTRGVTTYTDGMVTITNCKFGTCDIDTGDLCSIESFNAGLAAGDACYINEECQANLFCRGGDEAATSPTGVCSKRNDGESCSDGLECVSGLCANSGQCADSTCYNTDMSQFRGSSCDPFNSNFEGECKFGTLQCCNDATPFYPEECDCQSDGTYQCLAYRRRELSMIEPSMCNYEYPITAGGQCTAVISTPATLSAP